MWQRLAIHYLEQGLPHVKGAVADTLNAQIAEIFCQILQDQKDFRSRFNEQEIWILDEEEKIQKKTYYQLFDLKDTFSAIDLKKAYNRLMKQYHPDKFFGQIGEIPQKKLEEIAFRITKAHRILSDRRNRIKYNAFLRKRGISKY